MPRLSRTTRLFNPDYPTSPAQYPVFYGYIVVVAGVVATLCSIPGQTTGVGPFKEHLEQALGLSSVQISSAYMIGTAASAFVLPFFGSVYDRLGARPFAVATFLAFGLSLIYLSQIDGIAQAWALTGTGALVLMTLGFFLIRLLGQGMLTMIARTMMLKWFNRRRGLVTAVGGAFITVGFATAPLTLEMTVRALGWRETYFTFGACYLIVFAFLSWFFFRDNPEECGLEMDGGEATGKPQTEEQLARYRVWREYSAPQAAATLPFWLFAGGISMAGLLITGVLFHAEALSNELGLPVEEFYALLIPIAVVNVVTGFFFGWWSDRTRMRYILIVMMTALIVANLALLHLPAPWARVTFVVAQGVSWAGFGNLLNVPWPRFFGRRNLGSIGSWVAAILVLASSVGPMLFSLAETQLQSFGYAILTLLGVPALILLLAPFAVNPQRRHVGAGSHPPAG